jgi:hypothetical protein
MRYSIGVNFEGLARIEPNSDGLRLVELSGTGMPPESTDQWALRLRTLPPETSSARYGAMLEIESPEGGRLEGALQHGNVDLLTNDAGVAEAWALDLAFDVHGIAGAMDGATGGATLRGTVRRQGAFRATVDLHVDARDHPWLPPNAAPLDARDQAAGASHTAGRARRG